ncbi:MAG: phage portal protein, partial [Cyanobacteria bacterium REEB65]|nr:phage portal protein [Cyanobacteria bacterium REEB65]
QVIHWYEHDRANQQRGIPRITSSLPLFSQKRRWTKATLTAAEFAASIAGILKTSRNPEEGGVDKVDAWEFFEIAQGALMSLPAEWDADQMSAQHPNSSYSEFNREILNECGRGTGAPLNVTTGNSSGYNFSSGRLDHLPYNRQHRIDRTEFDQVANDRTFAWWTAEAVMAYDEPIPGTEDLDEATGEPIEGTARRLRDFPGIDQWSWGWMWDPFDSLDPVNESTADDTRLKNGTATYAEILSEDGKDWREHMRQLAREKQFAESLGLPWPLPTMVKPAAPAGAPGPAEQGQGTAPQPGADGVPPSGNKPPPEDLPTKPPVPKRRTGAPGRGAILNGTIFHANGNGGNGFHGNGGGHRS